jgi:hypothetical protein
MLRCHVPVPYSDEAYTKMPSDHHANAHSLKLNALLLNTLRDPHVRRLAWSTLSGSLLETPTQDQTTARNPQHRQWQSAFALDRKTRNFLCKRISQNQGLLTQWCQHLIRLDLTPEPLLNYIDRPECKRLGRYFEQLWLYFLDWHPDINILCANQQMTICESKGSSRQRTLGEIDALVQQRHSPHQGIHIEMALKFYLQLPNGRWLGPNQRDYLDLKLDRLLTQQLKLSQHPQFKSSFPTLNITEGLLISGLLCTALQTSATNQSVFSDYLLRSLSQPWTQPRVGFWGTKEQWETATKNIKSQQFFANGESLWQHIQPLTDKRDWLGAAILNMADINKKGCHPPKVLLPEAHHHKTKRHKIDYPQMLGIRFHSALGTQCLPIGFCISQDFADISAKEMNIL